MYVSITNYTICIKNPLFLSRVGSIFFFCFSIFLEHNKRGQLMFQDMFCSYFMTIFQENKPLYTNKDYVSPKVIFFKLLALYFKIVWYVWLCVNHREYCFFYFFIFCVTTVKIIHMLKRNRQQVGGSWGVRVWLWGGGECGTYAYSPSTLLHYHLSTQWVNIMVVAGTTCVGKNRVNVWYRDQCLVIDLVLREYSTKCYSQFYPPYIHLYFYD